MSYTIEILRSAQKRLAKIDRQDQAAVLSAIRNLADTPRPIGCKRLSGRPAWRLRIGNYRIIYEIYDDRLIILVISVGHRSEV